MTTLEVGTDVLKDEKCPYRVAVTFKDNGELETFDPGYAPDLNIGRQCQFITHRVELPKASPIQDGQYVDPDLFPGCAGRVLRDYARMKTAEPYQIFLKVVVKGSNPYFAAELLRKILEGDWSPRFYNIYND